MAEKQTLSDLSRLRPAVQAPVEEVRAERKVDAQGRSYATGRRKDAVARVWIKPGSGKFLVKRGSTSMAVHRELRANVDKGKAKARTEYRDLRAYFARSTLQMIVLQPFVMIDRLGRYDVVCTVTGGGLSGQAGAVRHGLARALVQSDPELRPTLKHGGFLTRDDREVERKKYGRAKARRSFQFSKR